MRKILVVALVALFAITGLCAATASTGDGNDSSKWTNGSPAVNLRFTIDPESTPASYKIGFSTDASGSALASADVTLSIADTSNPVAIKNASDLYVYWDIVSPQSFVLSLEASGPLTQDTEEQDKDTIQFTVTGDSTVQGSVANTNPGETISIDSSADSKSSTILRQGTSAGLNAFKGYQKLTIASKDNELIGKAEDDYLATLTLKVSAN